MRPETEEWNSEEIKAWILSREFPPLRCELPMGDQIALALHDLGCERIRVNQVAPHPVWNVAANMGRLRADSVRAVKTALKKLCAELGFRVGMSEIVASVYRGRLNAAFALAAPDATPVEVEHDGQWVPEHLEEPP